MPPVYASDRKAAEEEQQPEVKPRTWLSVVGLLWLGNAAFSATELRDARASSWGVALAAVGACVPLLLARIRGTADDVPKPVWVAAAVAWVAGTVWVADSVRWWIYETPPWTFRIAMAVDAAVGALFLACGAYMVSRSIGSLPAERTTFLRGSLLLLALRIATVVVMRVVATVEVFAIVAVLILMQCVVVGWVYVRLLAARPHVRRIAGLFE